MKIFLPEVKTFYINLDEDKQKSDQMQYMLSDLGFKDVNRFPGVRATPKLIGVAHSHKALLDKMANYNKPFLVFEDDVAVENFKAHIEVPDSSDAVYLGNSVFGLFNGIGRKRISVEHVEEDLFRIYNMLAAHAILYTNNDYVKFLSKAIEFNISIKTNQDKARAETMKYWNIYGFKDPMFYQNDRHEPVTRISLPSKFGVPPQKAFGPI